MTTNKIDHSKLYRPSARGKNIVYASQVPRYLDLGILVAKNKFKETIEIGSKFLSYCNHDDKEYMRMLHINMMQAYFKSRMQDETYFGMSTYHAQQAMIYGHNTGLAQERILINLKKSKKFHLSIKLCELIISDKFRFSNYGYGEKEYYLDQKCRLIKRLGESIDKEHNILFTDSEIEEINKNSVLNPYE